MSKCDRRGAARKAAPYLALAAVACLFLWELVAMAGVPVARDMQMFFVPQLHVLAEALGEGRIPLWTPLYNTGAPLMANFQVGVFYPPHWLFAALPFLPAFNLLIVGHLALGGILSYALARRLELSIAAAGAVALGFMLGGYFCSLLNLYNVLKAAAWSPGMALALLHHAERRSPASLALLVGTFLLAFFAGEPQTFLLASVTGAALLVVRAEARPELTRRPLALAGSLVLAAAAVAGLAMVQLLPTARMVAESTRGAGLGLESAGHYSLEPIRLVHLLVPPDYGDPVYRFGFKANVGARDPWLFSLYLGAAWLPLFWASWRAERRREIVFWTALVGAGIVLALGIATPVYGWLYSHVPGVSAFRFPEKFFFLTAFGAAMLGGYGVEALLRRRVGRRRDLAALLAWIALLIAARLLWGAFEPAIEDLARNSFPRAMVASHVEYAFDTWTDNIDRTLILTVIFAAIAWLLQTERLGRGAAAALLLLFLGVDLGLAGRGLNPVVDPSFYRGEPAVAEHLPMPDLRTRYRYVSTPLDEAGGVPRAVLAAPIEAQKWMWQHTLQPNVGQLFGVMAYDAWDAIHLRRSADQWDLQRLLADDERRWRLLRLGSVRHIYARFPLPDGVGLELRSELDSLPGMLYELHGALPRAYVAERGRWFEDPVQALNAALSPGFDPAAEVALLAEGEATSPERPASAAAIDSSAAPADSGGVPPAARRTAGGVGPADDAAPPADAEPPGATIVRDGGEVVRVRLTRPADGFLVLTDSWYPGWAAVVDGEERPLHRANFFYRAVRVRPGDREVVFRYRSAPFEAGARVSLATLLLFVTGIGIAGARRGLGHRAWREEGA